MNEQGTIPSDWTTGEYCRYAICWPNSPQWLAVLRGVLTLPARGRFWDEHTGSILGAQSVIRETFDYNLHLRGVIMACEDPGLNQIAIALTRIATALASGANCCERQGGGGAGTTAPPFDETIEGDPNTDPPPTGFDTWEEFNAQKCAIAWNIVETLQGDLGEMAILNFGGVSLSSLAALLAIAFVTPIPFDDVIAIAGLLLTVVAEIIITTALSLVNDNEEDLVCELYSGASSADSRTLYLAKFSEFVASGVSDPIEAFAINALMSYMVGSSVTNRLYTKDLTRIWGERDCTNCADDWTFAILPSGPEAGVMTSGSMDDNSVGFTASATLEVSPDSCPGHYLMVVHPPTGGKNASITLASGGLSTPSCGVQWQWIRQSDGTLFNFGDGAYAFDANIGSELFTYFACRSAIPFELEFTITP